VTAAGNGGARRRVRLIALDLDGTLMGRDHTVSAANRSAVHDAVAAGIHIVLATSRWYMLAKRTAEQLGIHSPIICNNGAMVREASDGARLLDLRIPAEAARDIASAADELRCERMVTVDDVTYVATSRAGMAAAAAAMGMQIADQLSEHVVEGAESFLFFGREAVDAMLDRVRPAYAGQLNLASGYSESFPPYLNIVHGGADKGRALQLVCGHVGVPIEESMAIGDAAPDLDMLRVAGVSMAMGNAPDDVKSQVDVVGPSNDDDGVAWAIREFAL
jgi:Cof subfamily protein (haloacid dehalogenase superfamily)